MFVLDRIKPTLVSTFGNSLYDSRRITEAHSRCDYEQETLPAEYPAGIHFDDEKVTHNLHDLEFVKTLGTGAFGRIRLVKPKSSKLQKKSQTYALKSLSKRKILKKGFEQQVLDEKDILMELNHPFIVQFHCAMQDEAHIYFLMEVLLGGELFSHLQDHNRFCEGWSRFYSASVILAFSQMHAKKIAYRDLKPENLVMDQDGYLKIVDFGFAKKLMEQKTYTFCGTSDYLAPEIILRKGHDWAVDYWALGVLLFEMTAGYAPFYGRGKRKLYEQILTGNIEFPHHFSYGLINLIKKLMKVRSSERIGMSQNGISDIMLHEWFFDFEWNALLSKKLDVPIKPRVENCEDARNFLEFPEDECDADCTEWYPIL